MREAHQPQTTFYPCRPLAAEHLIRHAPDGIAKDEARIREVIGQAREDPQTLPGIGEGAAR